MRQFFILATFLFSFVAWSQAALLHPVARTHICMQKDEEYKFAQKQIKIGKRTYSYCCDFCKGKLKNEADVRVAVDPFSGKSIDKSLAFPAATESGRVIYFENEKNFRDYIAESATPTATKAP